MLDYMHYPVKTIFFYCFVTFTNDKQLIISLLFHIFYGGEGMQTSEKIMEMGNDKSENEVKEVTLNNAEVKVSSRQDIEENCDCVNCRLGRIEKRIEHLLSQLEKYTNEKKVL
jgi:hypothetical protein